jgi:tripartite-type tricarboxylate transporter receptor subunit TctC
MNRRQATTALGASVLATLLPSLARAESGVVDTVRLVLAPPPGTTVDFLARKVGDSLKPAYANTVVVDNRPGAAGIIAVNYARSAAPDGTTILVEPSPPITIYPLTYKKLPYNPDTDLIPVSLGATIDLAFAVGPMVPASVTNLKEYFAWCKANPAKASFGSPGAGSMPHFVGSMTARVAGVELQHVPYKGPSPAITDLLAGQVSGVVSPLGDFTEYAAAGKCRILGTTGPQRSRFTPNVPSFAEQGFGKHASRDWIGFFLPAGTPPAIVQKLSATLKVALSQKEVIAALGDHAMEAEWCTPEQLKARVRADRAAWTPVVKELNFTIDS